MSYYWWDQRAADAAYAAQQECQHLVTEVVDLSDYWDSPAREATVCVDCGAQL